MSIPLGKLAYYFNTKEVLTQWYTEFSECFAGLRDNIDLAFDDDFLQRINGLKIQFDALSPDQQEVQSNFECTNLNSEITLEEVQNAVNKSKLGKAFLLVPNEALNNPEAIRLLHKLLMFVLNLALPL